MIVRSRHAWRIACAPCLGYIKGDMFGGEISVDIDRRDSELDQSVEAYLSLRIASVLTMAMKHWHSLVILLCLARVCHGCPFSASLGRRALKQTGGPALDWGFYDESCPSLDQIVSDKLSFYTLEDIRTPGKILRLFFHDCVAQGCDASILLNSTSSNIAEKDAVISATLDKFYVIEDIKAAAEDACPGIVSCADILALATVHSVRMAGGPVFTIDLGRRDGWTSYAGTAEYFAPLSTFKVDELLANFANIGLDETDLVVLSGAHTIGEIHCTNFADRFTGSSPFPDVEFGKEMWNFCSQNGAYPEFAAMNLITFMDLQSPNMFDAQYYISLINGRGIMTSDQELFNDARTKPLVQAFAADRTYFFNSFVTSMQKLGRLGVLTGTNGVIRKQCGVSP